MEDNQIITMGRKDKSWKGGDAKTITFSVTEECNLACKYCYMIGKNSKNKMSFRIAKKAIDYILSNTDIFNEEAVIWDFIGGEPLMEIELIDKISDYIKQQMYILDHPWFDAYKFSISSNGLLYSTPKVQKYITKNKNHISIGLSIDGNKIKHDLQRIKPNGEGSYDDVIKNVPLWLEQFPNATTKATFSHDDLLYLKDSIVSLWNNGIKNVSANVVFEDVWHENDDTIFENQLIGLADYILDNELWQDYNVKFFSPEIGFPLSKAEKYRNTCGAGKMLAIDHNGKFYPCIRFLDFTLNNQSGLSIGDVNKGINFDKLRPFQVLNLENQSKQECLECEVATGCSWCIGYNYDASSTGTIFERSTAICKMHKANIRANDYFWRRFKDKTGLVSPKEIYSNKRYLQLSKEKKQKYLQFILSDNITPHCIYRNQKNTNNYMSEEILSKGLQFAIDNGFTPVFLNDSIKIINSEKIDFSDSLKYDEIPYLSEIPIYDNNVDPILNNSNGVLLIKQKNLYKLSEFVKELSSHNTRINIILENIGEWDRFDIEEYEYQLDKLANFVIEMYIKQKDIHINVLTDLLNSSSIRNCGAGNNSFALAPNGKIYLCPAFYFNDESDYIGDINKGILLKNEHLLENQNQYICNKCDAYHCRRCKFLNKKMTNEINISPKIQCVLSHIERNKSKYIQDTLANKYHFNNIIKDCNLLDPIEEYKVGGDSVV